MTTNVASGPDDPGTTPGTVELSDIRQGLVEDVARLRREIADVDATPEAAVGVGEGGGDVLDVASSVVDFGADTVRAENTAAILAQTKRVISRLDQGLYGVCELCLGPIGADRLAAFPRATICIRCAART